MYDVENKMVAEGNYEMTKEAYEKMYKLAYEVDSPEDESEDAQREYLLDEIDKTKVVGDFLDAAGLWSIRDIVSFFEDATLDDLQSLKDDLEAYDREERDHDNG